MNDRDVTAQILSAWDEVVEEEEGDSADSEAAVTVEEPDEVEEPDDESEPSEEEQEPEEQEDESDDEPEEEGEPQEPEPTPQFEDVEIQAYLAKYGGDIEQALKGASELQRLIGRRDDEKLGLSRRVEELQAQLAQAQAFGSGSYMTDEQQAWVESAAESANPGVYVQQAVQQGEFELARAVCREWAQSNPFEAMRAGQLVDAVQVQFAEAEAAPQEVPPATTWQALSRNYPDLKTYEEQMVQTLDRLGREHPLVQEARSTDPAQAVRGIFGIYEIAKAATFALAEQKDQVRRKRREETDAAIDNAVVTSAAASPSNGETPRGQRLLMPGLTQEALDAAFDAEFARQQ